MNGQYTVNVVNVPAASVMYNNILIYIFIVSDLRISCHAIKEFLTGALLYNIYNIYVYTNTLGRNRSIIIIITVFSDGFCFKFIFITGRYVFQAHDTLRLR